MPSLPFSSRWFNFLAWPGQKQRFKIIAELHEVFVSTARARFIRPVMPSDLLSTLVSHISEVKKKR